MTRVGIRVSQAGIPVERAPDYQKMIDERWPVLEHQFMGVITINNLSTDSPGVLNNAGGTVAHVPIHKHSLGHLPAFRFKQISYSGFTTTAPISMSLFADETYIWLIVNKSAGAILINLSGWLAIVDRDCTKEFQADIGIVTSTQKSRPSQYGLKILNEQPPQGMNEKNKGAYTMNTNAKSMTIQQHGIQNISAASVPAYNLAINHRLGYPPTYYIANRYTHTGATNPSLGKTVMGAIDTVVGIAKSNTITLTVRGAQSLLIGDYMFIILKDPVDVAR